MNQELGTLLGDVAQLGERGVRNAEVRGSIPLISTISFTAFGNRTFNRAGASNYFDMKHYSILVLTLAAVGLFAMTAAAQRNIAPAVELDPILEADANHNLDVARQAFGPRKAYKQVLLRFEETFAAHPEFSNMEEFLYMAGMSSYYLSKNEGRQKVNLKVDREREKYAPEKLREDAVAYLGMMLERYPESKFRDQAESVMNECADGRHFRNRIVHAGKHQFDVRREFLVCRFSID